MSDGRLVIVGGDAAGMSAASKVRREQPRREIVVFEETPHTSYSACGIPYLIGGLVEAPQALVARSPETFRDEYRIDVRTGHRVLAVDPSAREVLVRDRSGGREFREPYDQLLLATGARPFCPAVEGAGADGIFGLSSLQSALRVQEAIARLAPRSAVVVGGGYIGLEMAEALVRRGLPVSLVQRGPEVMSTLDPDMAALVSQALRETGVTVLLGETLVSFMTREGRVAGVVTDRRTLPADLVILGMGVRPASELASDAGIPLGARDAVRVDERQRTGTEGVWAAGDCAVSRHRISGREMHVALGTVANKQGVVAGTNLAGGDAVFPGVVGTAVSKICSVEVARTGLQEREIEELGWDYATATIRSRTRAGYYPGAGRVTVKMLGEKGSGRLLGAQIVGIEGAAKRIDVVATALTAGMTVADLVDLDLGYAPPFSPVWDPVQTAARKLVKLL